VKGIDIFDQVGNVLTDGGFHFGYDLVEYGDGSVVVVHLKPGVVEDHLRQLSLPTDQLQHLTGQAFLK
jgi:hypothetical protein